MSKIKDFPKKDLKVTYYRGQGPGGQHRNKTANACRILHVPSGIVVTSDDRKRTESFRNASKAIEERVQEAIDKVLAQRKKQRRDKLIKDSTVVRTYNYKRNQVKDHRTGKTASLKRVLDGDLDAIR